MHERHLLLGSMVMLPVIALLVRLLGALRTCHLLDRLSGAAAPRCADAATMHDAERLAQVVALAGRRGVITATCLRQAILVHWLLRRRGLAPDLKLGVRRAADALDAHAWVELQGVALAQPGLRHAPFVKAGPLISPVVAGRP